MSVTQEIKNRLDIVDIISEQVPLRKAGSGFSGFCPFHSNTRTPAFHVFPETQTWHCFGECSEGGDVFSFVMKKEGWDFREALENLARRAGVALEEPSPQQRRFQEKEDKLVNLLTAAAEYFQQLLEYAPQGEHARQYVNGRGFNKASLEAFQVGFALNSWDACRTHFNAQGYEDDDLLQAGLLSENTDTGRRYDRFRNRLMIPIRDVSGRVVGFGARTLEKDGIPKYLNSPQTAVFDKSNLLFGLDMARRHIREARQAVIVEGYMDVMQGWQAGFRNMVAQMGTALTAEHLQILKRYTKRFVLALDADAAGAKATMRGLDIARQAVDREVQTVFDARGILRHESRLKADIRVVTLPDGEDPDDIIRQSPERWPQIIEAAKPIVSYVIEVATAGIDLNDAKAKSDAVAQVMPLIATVMDPIERGHYRQELARVLGIDEQDMRLYRSAQIAQSGPTTQAPRQAPQENISKANGGPHQAMFTGRAVDTRQREAYLLRQCLQYPHLIRKLNQLLEHHQLPGLRATDFELPENRQIMAVVYERDGANQVVSPEELCDSLDAVLAEQIRTLLKQPIAEESELGRLPEHLVKSLLDWRLARAKAEMKQVGRMVNELRAGTIDQPVTEPLRHRSHLLWEETRRINRAKDALSAAGKRRAEDEAGP